MPTGPQRPVSRPARPSGPFRPASPARDAAADSPLPDLPYGEWLRRAAGPDRPQLRARATAAAMLTAFLIGGLAAGWLHAGVLSGLSFVAGAAAGMWYCRRSALLRVVVLPPALFLLALLAEQIVTAQGGSATAAAESVLAGTVLTLSADAPWLFCGMVLTVAVAWRRGLRQCAADLRAELTGNPARQAAAR